MKKNEPILHEMKVLITHKMTECQWSSCTQLLDTLWFQLEDTVLLIGTLLLFDPVLFPKYEA